MDRQYGETEGLAQWNQDKPQVLVEQFAVGGAIFVDHQNAYLLERLFPLRRSIGPLVALVRLSDLRSFVRLRLGRRRFMSLKVIGASW